MKKVFMFDLDGTLINEDYIMSDKTIKALRTLKEKGYCLVCNSGRPIFLSSLVTDKYLGEDFFDYIYGNNGGSFYSSNTKEFKLLKFLTVEQLKEASRIYDNPMFLQAIYEANEDTYNFYINHSFDEEYLHTWINARCLKPIIIDYSIINEKHCKMILIHSAQDYEKAEDYINNHQIEYCGIAHSSKYVIEIVPKGVSKASAVEHFVENTNYCIEDILAFGDSANDIPMLKITDGVIMENANEENKKIITKYAPSIDDGGIYDYLKKENYI